MFLSSKQQYIIAQSETITNVDINKEMFFLKKFFMVSICIVTYEHLINTLRHFISLIIGIRIPWSYMVRFRVCVCGGGGEGGSEHL